MVNFGDFLVPRGNLAASAYTTNRALTVQ